MKRFLNISLLVFLIALLWSCERDDDFSDNPDLRLSFSSDTISFDTVFTKIGSSTRQLKIYNRNKKSLSIESILLMSGDKSGFRINIDGQKGTSFTNVDILKQDSLFTFIEVTVNPLQSDNPTLIRDSIRFITNGNTQYVQLEAVGQNVTLWHSKVIESDTILTGEKPFLVYESVIVEKGATLHLKENTRFYFRNKASLKVYGTLIADGSVEQPILMRGDRTDNIENGIAYDKVPGQWDGVYIFGESYNNQLNNVYIRNASNGLIFLEASPVTKKAMLDNVIVHNSSQNGMVAINCDIDAQNCQFTNSKKATVIVAGGKYSFTHCTIANYYRWGNREQEALIVSNNANGKDMPLDKCNFINSIIYGSKKQEFLLSEAEGIAFNYLFHSCIIRGKEINDNHFTDIIWNVDPEFVSINKGGSYNYNYELNAESPAIGKADKTFSILVPTDMKGVSRLNGSADMGCYQYVAP